MNECKISGVLPDPANPGDFLFPVDFTVNLPSSVSWRPEAPAVDDQAAEGSCTANALTGNAESFLDVSGKFVKLSRQFNYWTSRYLFNGGVNPTQDTGSTAACMLAAAAQFGVCTEATWPYDPSNIETQPSPAAYAEALSYKAGTFYRINSASSDWFNADSFLYAICYALAKGYEVQISFQARQSIFTLQPGQVYPVSPLNDPPAGGHQGVIVGYTWLDQVSGRPTFIVRNSWGPWCDGGYFLMSGAGVMADCFGAWVLESFAGCSVIGSDLTIIPTAPTSDSSVNDIMVYLYRTLFGRYPDAAGEAYWAAEMLTYFTQMLTADCDATDKAYMAANPPSTAYTAPTSASSVNQILTYIYQTYFGRLPDAAGEAYWAGEALAYFRTMLINGASVRDKDFMNFNNIQ